MHLYRSGLYFSTMTFFRRDILPAATTPLEGLELPDDFDPRVEKTLCFPRGLSRSQGARGG